MPAAAFPSPQGDAALKPLAHVGARASLGSNSDCGARRPAPRAPDTAGDKFASAAISQTEGNVGTWFRLGTSSSAANGQTLSGQHRHRLLPVGVKTAGRPFQSGAVQVLPFLSTDLRFIWDELRHRLNDQLSTQEARRLAASRRIRAALRRTTATLLDGIAGSGCRRLSRSRYNYAVRTRPRVSS